MAIKINKVAVIGSGIMGGGIAVLLASAGIRTLLLDIVPPNSADQKSRDPNYRNSIVKAGLDVTLMSSPPLIMQQKDVDLISIGNLEDDFNKIADCDWVIEVVVENLNVKRSIFKRIEGTVKPGTVVSSNTSGIPLESMSEGLGLKFRQHFLGTHFFNPVRYMKLLEIIAGQDTLPEVLDFMSSFGDRVLGKGIVWAKDTPNFIGNRIGVHGMLGTMQLMHKEGLTIPEVDALFGPSLGRPKTAMFKTADIVGLDVLIHVAKNTYDLAIEDESRNVFVIPDFVQKMVQKNLLGKKTQSGFYKTDLTPEWKKVRKVIVPDTMEYVEYDRPSFPCLDKAKAAKSLADKINIIVYGEDRGAKFVWKALASNLIYSANKIPEISDNILEVDNAMKWGFNFEMGPFEIWDVIGLEKSTKKMEKDGLSIPEKIKDMISSGHTSFYKLNRGILSFFDFQDRKYKEVKINEDIVTLPNLKSAGKLLKTSDSASLVDLGDDIFCLEFHTKMNAINGEIVDFMDECSDFTSDNGAGLVIGNQPKGLPGAFSAGGDLAFMADLANQKKYAEIESFLKRAQEGMQKIRYSNIPVVAAPYGLTLGGGCEVCLGIADRIVAHCDLYMGLVEIGVGLLPGGGGCLNLWKKMLECIPEAVIDIDLSKFFVPTFMAIATAKVSMSAAEARANGFLGPEDRIIFNRDHLISESKKEVIKMLSDNYSPPVKRPIKVFGDAARGMINAEIFNMKSSKYISEYDAFLAKRIAFVISGGDVRTNSLVDEEVILKLEREAFVDFWKQEKTIARVNHMLSTGKPLRN